MEALIIVTLVTGAPHIYNNSRPALKVLVHVQIKSLKAAQQMNSEKYIVKY